MDRDRQNVTANLPLSDLKTIITDPDGAKTLVQWADVLGKTLRDQGLATNQIRPIFGEVRRIQGEWRRPGYASQARRHLIMLKPKMAYRARRERGKSVETLVNVLDPAIDLVVDADPRPKDLNVRQKGNYQEDNFERFMEFFEAILAYHKAYGGN